MQSDMELERQRFFKNRKNTIAKMNTYIKELGPRNERLFEQPNEILFDGNETLVRNDDFLKRELGILFGYRGDLLNRLMTFLSEREREEIYLNWEGTYRKFFQSYVGKQVNFETFKNSLQQLLKKNMALNNIQELSQQINSNVISVANNTAETNRITSSMLVPSTLTPEEIARIAAEAAAGKSSKGKTDEEVEEVIPLVPPKGEGKGMVLVVNRTDDVDNLIKQYTNIKTPKDRENALDVLEKMYSKLAKSSQAREFFKDGITLGSQQDMIRGRTLYTFALESVNSLFEGVVNDIEKVIVRLSESTTTRVRDNPPIERDVFLNKPRSKFTKIAKDYEGSETSAFKYNNKVKLLIFYINFFKYTLPGIKTAAIEITDSTIPIIDADAAVQDEGGEEEDLPELVPIGGTGVNRLGSHKRLYIDGNKFRRNILEIRYKKNNHLHNDLKPMRIGSGLKSAIETALINGLEPDINMLSDEEKRIYKLLLRKWGRTLDKYESEDLNNRFEVIVGQIQSGNDNPLLKQQLRSLLVYAMKTKALSRDQVLEYFLEFHL